MESAGRREGGGFYSAVPHHFSHFLRTYTCENCIGRNVCSLGSPCGESSACKCTSPRVSSSRRGVTYVCTTEGGGREGRRLGGNTVLALAKERFLGESSEEWGWSNRAKGWNEERSGSASCDRAAPPLIFVACSIPFLGYYFYAGRKRKEAAQPGI